MEPPADVPPAPPPAAEDRYRCPRCGAPHDPFQEYCLECGARLVPYARAASFWRRDAWARESPLWFWATFLTLLLIALAAAAIVIAATNEDEPERRQQGAAPPGTSTFAVVPTDGATTPTLPNTLTVAPPPLETTTPTLPTTGADGTTTGANGTTTPTGTTTGQTTTGQTTTGASGTVIAWPTNREGFTVILASIRTSRGRATAEAQAREAIRKGLTEVGVLNSSDYSSLTAGYYVVFTGIHDTASEARAALPRAVNAGYPRAYYREITP